MLIRVRKPLWKRKLMRKGVEKKWVLRNNDFWDIDNIYEYFYKVVSDMKCNYKLKFKTSKL